MPEYRIASRTVALMVLMASTAIGPTVYAQFPGAPAPPRGATPDSKVPEGLEAPAATEGYKAYQAGDYVTAVNKLEEARQADPSGAILSWLGHAYAASGQPIKAVDALRLSLAATEKPLSDEQKITVNKKLEEVQLQVATVSISSSVPGATVIIDGGEQQALPVSGLRMRAGEHAFKVEAADHDAVERSIALQGGGQAQLELNPSKTPPPPPPPAPAPPPPVPMEPADGGTAGRIMRTAGIGTAVLGAIAGGVGIASLVNARSLLRARPTTRRVTRRCTATTAPSATTPPATSTASRSTRTWSERTISGPSVSS
jgi:hypothetical protein